ncbi:MAG: ATP-binding protein [Bdellovibrionales bacterium]|nr:ATP-binding protein [Bdellovibrionales bacterium]
MDLKNTIKSNCILSYNLKKIEDLQIMMDLFQDYHNAHAMNEKVFFDFKLCIEEVIVNIFIHGYKEFKKEPDINLCLYKTEDCFVADVIDNAKTFNPVSDFIQMNFATSIEKKPIGGLGIRLLKNLSDDLEYIPRESGNQLKIYKKYN